MSRIEKRPEAEVDLYEMWEYIAVDSPRDAGLLLKKLDEVFNLLVDNPEMGRTREELGEGLLSFPIGRFVIYYRSMSGKQGIEIVRVLHGKRDVEAELG